MSVPGIERVATGATQNRRKTPSKITHSEHVAAYLNHAATVLGPDAFGQLAILQTIARHADAEFGYVSSQRRIAATLGKARRRVQRQIAALEAAGLIHRELGDSRSPFTRYTLPVAEVTA